MATRSFCGGVLRGACSTTLTLVRVPRHGIARRHANIAASSSSSSAALPVSHGNFPPDPKPLILDRNDPRDVLVRAKAGTGRSAYILPAVESRLECTEPVYRSRTASPLILAPTRELAVQIASDALRLTAQRKGFEVQLLVGGNDMARQKKDWVESSRDLVVATPGRLRDLLTNEPEFRQGFKGCPVLILAETDTLLSMGFRDDIDAIVSFLPLPPLRKTLLFSTTVPRAVRQLASCVLSPEYTFVNAARPGLDLTLPRNEGHPTRMNLVEPCDDEPMTDGPVKQFHTLCPTASDQLPALLKLLAHDQLTYGSSSKVIVFCPTTQVAELFAVLLRSLAGEVLPGSNTNVLKAHSKMKQSDSYRAQVLFREAGGVQGGHPTVLITSDVRKGGVDYPGVTRVIQIGIPSKEALHIYRIERLARGTHSLVPVKGGEGKDGNSTRAARSDLLLLPWEAGYMDWHLTSLPITPLAVSALDGQLALLSPQLSSTLTTERLKTALAEVQHRVDPADVRSAAASLLGYYLPLTPPLRLQPHAVLAGVSSWASDCFNVTIPAIKRFPKKFTEAYEQSLQSRKMKGLFVDGLRLPGPSALGKTKSKNRSVWEGANTRRRPKRWY